MPLPDGEKILYLTSTVVDLLLESSERPWLLFLEDNLKSLKLFAMVSALENQQTTRSSLELSFEERLGILVDAQLAANDSKSLKTRLSKAKLRMSACLEDLDHKAGRGLDKTLLASLATSVWISRRRNIIIEGKTGAGKTYLACALAHQGCRDGYSVLYARAPALFEDLSTARAVGTFKTSLAALAKIRLLVLDDFAMAPMTDEQRKSLL